MPELDTLTAFGRTEARRRKVGPVLLAENVSVGLASLAIRRGDAAPQVKGIQLPDPGKWVEGKEISAFWTGPGQWMIEANGRADHDLGRDLRTAVPEAAITEQTDGWVVLDMASETSQWAIDRVMEKLVNLDPARLGPGCATRTGIEHMSVFVIRRRPTAVAVLGMRSMAASLWHAMETAIARVAGDGA